MVSDAAPTGILIRSLRVAYGEAVAVDDVDLRLPRGSVLSVLGPSGCGKSTLLRAIAGLEQPQAGSIEIHGEDQAGRPAHLRNLGMMFQEHALFPHRDVAGNVAFGLEMHGRSSSERMERTSEVLELVGLSGFEDRDVSSLSGGEAQRVALARALAPAPRVLLLDEPLAALDRVLREDLTAELGELFAALELTVVHVTHDQIEALTLADQVAVMRAGRIERVGPPADVWRDPGSVFVARFLGHHNIWQTPGGPRLVPPEAIAVDGGPGDPVEAVVESVDLREGRFRIRGTCAEGPVEWFVSEVGSVPGDRVHLWVDRSRVTSLAG